MKNKKYTTAEVKMLTVRETPNEVGVTDTPEKIVSYWNSVISQSAWFTPDKEQCVVVCLDAKLNPIGFTLVSMGTVNECMVHARDVFRPAIHMNATMIVLLHNHPSGDASPSAADYRITRRMKEAGALLMIDLMDHIIVGAPTGMVSRYSFREAGII
jgi:DNA repair protein RadC